jgi:DNA-binding NarL/FixJ family response regulator
MGEAAASAREASLTTAARKNGDSAASVIDASSRLHAPAPSEGMAAADDRTAVILVTFPFCMPALKNLAESSDIRVVGSASDPEKALNLLSRLHPAVFITEINGEEGESGLEVVRAARQLEPELRVIVLSKESDRASIDEAFKAGADIYLLIDADPEDLVAGMRQLFNRSVFIAGDWALPNPLQNSVLINGSFPALTRRELEILRLVAEGHTNNSMASMLWVTEQTIKFHLTNIYRKLEVRNRTEASRWAQLHGLLSFAHAKQAVDAA